MQQLFKPSIGSTILDICLNVYCSLNLLPKLIQDNNIKTLNFVSGVGDQIIYDTDFVADEFIQRDILKNNYKFVTGNLYVPNASFTNEQYLLIESGAIMEGEAGDLFLI
jgi:hypothetical protein